MGIYEGGFNVYHRNIVIAAEALGRTLGNRLVVAAAFIAVGLAVGGHLGS